MGLENKKEKRLQEQFEKNEAYTNTYKFGEVFKYREALTRLLGEKEAEIAIDRMIKNLVDYVEEGTSSYEG